MAVTIVGGIYSLSLPDTLVWVDRYESNKVLQSLDFTLGGNPVIRTEAIQAGYPITLQGETDTGWIPQSSLVTLINMANEIGITYQLTYNAIMYNVIFNHTSSPAVTGTPIIPRSNQQSGDWVIPIIRLLKV